MTLLRNRLQHEKDFDVLNFEDLTHPDSDNGNAQISTARLRRPRRVGLQLRLILNRCKNSGKCRGAFQSSSVHPSRISGTHERKNLIPNLPATTKFPIQ